MERFKTTRSSSILLPSNHKNRKMLPICVQYFNMEYGAGNYIVNVFENVYVRKTMNNLELDWEKHSSFKADNTNCDFLIRL